MQSLARRLRKNFQTGFEWIIGIDQRQMGRPAIEQALEHILKMRIDECEGRIQTLPCFAVEFLNALTQFVDGL